MKKQQVFKFFRTVHAWGGAVLALLLLLVGMSGSILVWKNEFVKVALVQTDVAFEGTPQAMATIAAAVEAQFDADDILQIQFPTPNFPLTKVTLADTQYAYLDTHGKILDQWYKNERWEEWLYDLHHRLLLEDLGLSLVGFAAMTMILLLVAGVIAFWPMRRGLRLGFWPKNITRSSLQAAHRNIGIVEALPLLMTLVTGATLAFPEQSLRLLVEPFRGEEYSLDFAEHLDTITGAGTGDWLPAMERALATFPGSQIRTAQVPSDNSPYRIIGLQQPGSLHPVGLSKVYIEAYEGWMDIRIDDQAQHIAERIYNLGYPLHTGRFDNVFYKMLLSISGILVAVLSSLGLLSFIKQYRSGA
jgi:uncharacterized iron-regulated membrane protein